MTEESKMKCEHCKDVELVAGTLDGVSFVPAKRDRKFFSTGVYGITAMVCPQCGRLANLYMDPETLRKVLAKKS